jgi:hypothetical protein
MNEKIELSPLQGTFAVHTIIRWCQKLQKRTDC